MIRDMYISGSVCRWDVSGWGVEGGGAVCVRADGASLVSFHFS